MSGRTVVEDPVQNMAKIGNTESAQNGKPIKKNFYQQHPEVSGMSKEAVSAWLEERQVVVEGSSLRPIQQFAHTGRVQSAPQAN